MAEAAGIMLHCTGEGGILHSSTTLLKMGRYYSTTMCYYWDISVK